MSTVEGTHELFSPAEPTTEPSPAVLPASSSRLLAGWTETGARADLVAHRRRYGRLPVTSSRDHRASAELVATVERSGLRGRGGGGFPTARKLAAVAAGRGPRTVVANGCEGDPASGKDAVLLSLAPHLVLDGILVALHAVGATDAILCLHEGSAVVPSVVAAWGERSRSVRERISLVEVPRRYVASEETALMSLLNGGDARPRGRTPRPTDSGVGGRPTLVDNVETLAHLALIARYGDAWFRTAGTADSPGTTLVTIGGAVAEPGVYEVDLGTPLDVIVDIAGGPTTPLQALQLGGLGGTWLAPDDGSMPLSHEAARARGTAVGIAALIALPVDACGLAETARILQFLAAESAGQCGPCMFGLPAIADDMTQLATRHHRGRGVTDRLQARLQVIAGRGACAHPDGAVRLAASALSVFAEDVDHHTRGKPCRWTARPTWFPVPALRARR